MKRLGTTIVLFVFLASLGACKKKPAFADEGDDTKAGLPPPIAKGVCRIDEYDGDLASKQTCTYENYVWSCVRAGVFSKGQCARGPMVPPPVDAALPDAPWRGPYGLYGGNAYGLPAEAP